MAFGSCICMFIQLAGFLLLHVLGIIPFTYRVVLGTIGGVIIANLSFVILCLAVQKAADTTDQKVMKSRMQMSYNLRLVLQAGWVVIAFITPCFHVLAAAAPLLYPTVIIFFLQSRGKLVEPSERKNPEGPDEEDDEEEHLGSFEI